MEAVFDGTCLHSNIYSLPNNALLYNISTTLGTFFGRKVTTLRCVSGFNPAGAIHWRKRRFEVYGRAVPFDAVKVKEAGMFSSSRRWKWSVNSYKVEYQSYLWTAELNGSTEALFRPYLRHLFDKDEPTKIQISPAAQEDEIFLLLVFVYSEVKRLDTQRNAIAGPSAGFKTASTSEHGGGRGACVS